MTDASFGTQTYTYDKIYEVIGADYPAFYAFSDMTYQYDACWNRESTVNGGTTNYLTNNLNQYTSVGGTAYTYDANGNLTTDGTQTYYYDCENKLTKVVRNSDGQTLGEYKYDPFGKRVQKISSGITTNFIFDQISYQVLEERSDAGVLLRLFTYGSVIDEPLIMYQVDTYYYYYRDGLGSVVNLTDLAGATAKSYDYDVYGGFSSSGSLSGNSYSFTGRGYDSESGVFYYRARYYSPELGRFLQVDPIKYNVGPNIYNYVDNNPCIWVDPLGLQKQSNCLITIRLAHGFSEPKSNWNDYLTRNWEEMEENAQRIVYAGCAMNNFNGRVQVEHPEATVSIKPNPFNEEGMPDLESCSYVESRREDRELARRKGWTGSTCQCRFKNVPLTG